MRYVKCWTVALAILFSVGCSSSDPPPPPPAKTVFDPLTHQLDRARDVGKTVEAQAEQTHKDIDKQEGGDTSP
jgi:hypothetical protein